MNLLSFLPPKSLIPSVKSDMKKLNPAIISIIIEIRLFPAPCLKYVTAKPMTLNNIPTRKIP